MSAIQVIRNPSLYKGGMRIIIGIFFVLIIGGAIADAKWSYLAIPLMPFIVILSLKKPFIFPFGAYVFFIPFDSVLSVTGNEQGPTLTKFLGIFTVLILLLKGTVEKKLKRPDNVGLWWTLFIAYAFFSICWAIEPELVSSRIPTVMGLFFLNLMVSMYHIKKAEYDTLKWCILIGGIVAAIFMIQSFEEVQYFHGTSQRGSLIYGERETNPNYFALTLIIPVFICCEIILKEKKKLRKGLSVAAFGILIYGIILTGSRGVLLGVIVGFLIYLYSMKSFSTKKRIALVTVLIVMGIGLSFIVPEYFVERASTSIETGGAGRVDIWSIGYTLIKEYWLIGAGLDNFPVAYSQYGNFTDPHNIYLKTFVELGIVGISLFILVVMKHFRVIRSTVNQHNSEHVMLKAALSAILVSSFFSTYIWSKSFWLIFAMIIMSHNVLRNESKFYSLISLD